MNTINLEFQKVIEKMAEDRGLTVSGDGRDGAISGVLRFNGDDVASIKIPYLYATDGMTEVETKIEADDEADFVKKVEAALYKFDVDKWEYEAIAEAELDGNRCVERTTKATDGSMIQYEVYLNEKKPFMISERLRETQCDLAQILTNSVPKERWDIVFNNFDYDLYLLVREKVAERRDAEDAAWNETKRSLRNQFIPKVA